MIHELSTTIFTHAASGVHSRPRPAIQRDLTPREMTRQNDWLNRLPDPPEAPTHMLQNALL